MMNVKQRSNGYKTAKRRGHVALFYNTKEERKQALAMYFKEGLDLHELCVLVTPEPASTVIAEFEALGFACAQAVVTGNFRIFEMNAIYLPDGSFSTNYML